MRRLAWTALAMAVCLAWSGEVQAGFLSDFSGYTVFGVDLVENTGDHADGHVSFAVYENTDGNWTNDFAGVTPLAAFYSAALDAAATYVYMYQIVNTNPLGPGEGTLDSLVVPFFEGLTSFGSFSSNGTTNPGSGVIFSGVGPVNGGLGGYPVGASSNSETPDIPGDGSPTDSGTTPTLVGNASATRLSSGSNVSGGTIGFMTDPGTAPNAYSTVFFFTSDIAPSWQVGSLTASQSFGDIPATPVPAAAILLLTGLPFGFALRRRINQADC